MFKKRLKWLSIMLCLLLICGVFFLYIYESIESIISEQTEPEHDSETAPSPVIASVTPLQEDTKVAQWRVIERSQSDDQELQYYSASNVRFDGERVVITARKEFMGDKRYTSGMVESNEAYLYGRFSFVIRISEGKGLFPAIWLMPLKGKALPEIDMFEMIGSSPDEFYGVVHYMDASGQKRDYFKTKVKKKETYLIELVWAENKLSWFIDGVCMHESSEFVPNEFMYLIVNQAVGGSWPGSPNKDTVFPASFVLESWAIDPVRRLPR